MGQLSHIRRLVRVGMKQGLLERTTRHMIGPRVAILPVMELTTRTLVLQLTTNQEPQMPISSRLMKPKAGLSSPTAQAPSHQQSHWLRMSLMQAGPLVSPRLSLRPPLLKRIVIPTEFNSTPHLGRISEMLLLQPAKKEKNYIKST
jgi:hypothetical protein